MGWVTLFDYCIREIAEFIQHETGLTENLRGVHQTWKAIRVGDVRAKRAYKRRKTVAHGMPQLMKICVGNMGRYTRNGREREREER